MASRSVGLVAPRARAALVAATTAWMAAEGVVAPDRLTARFAPAPPAAPR